MPFFVSAVGKSWFLKKRLLLVGVRDDLRDNEYLKLRLEEFQLNDYRNKLRNRPEDL